MNKKYTVAWVALVAAGTVIETIALRGKKPGSTATAHVRVLTRTRSGKMVVGASLGWLAVHLLVPQPGRFWKGFAVQTPTEVPPRP